MPFPQMRALRLGKAGWPAPALSLWLFWGWLQGGSKVCDPGPKASNTPNSVTVHLVRESGSAGTPEGCKEQHRRKAAHASLAPWTGSVCRAADEELVMATQPVQCREGLSWSQRFHLNPRSKCRRCQALGKRNEQSKVTERGKHLKTPVKV